MLAKEVAYQTVGNGLTKVLKDAKKSVGPCFPISYGTYVLDNFNPSLVDIEQLKAFSFPNILNMPYDPNGVAKYVTT